MYQKLNLDDAFEMDLGEDIKEANEETGAELPEEIREEREEGEKEEEPSYKEDKKEDKKEALKKEHKKAGSRSASTVTEESNPLEVYTPPPPPKLGGKGEKESKEKPAVSRREAENTAKAYVNTLDFLVSRLCSIMSGESFSRYQLTKEEKKHYEEASADFFELERLKVSPKWLFLSSTITVFSSIIFLAYKDRKKKKAEEASAALLKQKAEKAAEEKSRQIQRNRNKERSKKALSYQPPKERARTKEEVKTKTVTPLTVYREDVPEAISGRANFEIYAPGDKMGDFNLLGKYKRNAENDRLKYEEANRGEEPSPYVLGLLENLKNKGLAKAKINKIIREHIRSLPPKNPENE